MKKVLALLVVSAAAFAIAAAGPPTKATVFTQDKLETIEENLALCLNCYCPGSRTSAALTVRQVKEIAPDYEFDNLVIPLMRIVKDEDQSDVTRIAAGLALHDLKSERGDYAISMSAKFTESPRVKKIFSLLAADREVAKKQQK